MNVIFGVEQLDILKEQKYTTLEFDTVFFAESKIDTPIPVYGVLSPEDVAIDKLPKLEEMSTLHDALIKNYKEKNWGFCINAIDHLQGFFPDVAEEFYTNMLERVKSYAANEPSDEEWNNGIITV